MTTRASIYLRFLLPAFAFIATALFALADVAGSVSQPAGSDVEVTGSGNAGILDLAQQTYDFDFGSLLFGPPNGSDQQTTLAVDSVNGSDANAGTLGAPKLTLPSTALSDGSVLGILRGSTYRATLPLPTSTTHGITVQNVALGSVKPLPVVSALDVLTNSSFTSNGDGTYSCLWTPAETIVNDGYSNVYVVVVNTGLERTRPIAARQRMVDLTSRSAVAATLNSAWVQPPGTGPGQSGSATQWKVTLHAPISLNVTQDTFFRYEVVSRVQPANWGSFDSNAGDGAMSGLVLVGGSSGYGSLSGPRGFVGDRLAFLHAATHGAVIGGGSLQRSVFYEAGDDDSIQLAWYAGTGTGLRFDTARCLFFANVGDRPANGIIAHTGGSTTFDQGDISDCAFLGARWSDGSLKGTAIDYVNVAAGTIDRVFVQAVRDVFGTQMPLVAEVKNSVFRGVHTCRIGENFHDNIVLAENGADPKDTTDRWPYACAFQQAGASAMNNLLWAHTAINSGILYDDQVSGITTDAANCISTHNIFVLDPLSTTTAPNYLILGGPKTGHTIDYNLVINLSKAGFQATNPNGSAFLSWSAYRTGQALYDQHSLYVDLSADPRGLKAVFADPANGDFRWAPTDVGVQCATYCTANKVGPATVTTHWPTVPLVDDAVAAISALPPAITSPGAVTFTSGVYGEYKITTNTDGTPDAPTRYGVAGQPAWLSVNASNGVMSGTPPQAGTFNVSDNATNLAGTGSAILGVTVQTAFAAWQNNHFTATELNNPSISGPKAAPAGDGISNVMKYALGLSPKVDGTRALPTTSFTTVGGASFLTLTYNKSLAASDVVCTVEVSGDLRTWSSDAGSTATVSAINNAAGTMQTVVQRDLTPTGGTRQRFIRLKISQP